MSAALPTGIELIGMRSRWYYTLPALKKRIVHFQNGTMNIYIGNLPPHVSEAQLWDLFKAFGQVNSVHIVTDAASGKSMGFGFVDIAEREGGLMAIQKLDTLKFMNRHIEVSEALSHDRVRTYLV